MAAGVVSGVGTGKGNNSISGASGLENSYLIDGVNITNTGYGGIGAYNIIYGSLGTGVTSEFLDEVQIKTGGFEAEYGQALGGIINTIVKSGTNEFKGSVAWYASPSAFRNSIQPVELSTGSTNTVEQNINDFAVSFGGPIKKDKLFYFVAYNPVITIDQRHASTTVNPAFPAAQAGVAAFDTSTSNGFGVTDLAFPSSVGNLERKRTANNYAVKLSWQASPKHVLELTAFGDPANGDGPQRPNASRFTDFNTGGGESSIHFGSNNQALKWNAVFSPKFFMEAQVTHHFGKFREGSTNNSYEYEDIRNVQEFIRGATDYIDPSGPTAVPFKVLPVEPFQGGVGFISNQDDKDTQYQVKFTSIVGKHEIKYGLSYDDISYRDTAVYTGPSFNITIGGSPIPTRGGAVVDVRNTLGVPQDAYDTANVYRVIRARISPEAPPTSAEERNGFIQDTWSITPRWTIKAGVRVTQETIKGSGKFSLTLGTLGTTDYEPTSYTFAGNIAPRVGVIWDVLGNGKSRAWVNFGRYFERVPNDLAVRAFSNEVGISVASFTDSALTTQTGSVRTQGITPTDVVGGVKLPYEDEISGGYAFEVTPNSSLEVRAIFRTEGRILEDTQVNTVEAIQNYYYGVNYGYAYDPFGGSQGSPVSTSFPAKAFGPYLLGNPGTRNVPTGLAPGTNFPKAKRNYKALEMVYTKRFSDSWSLYANYRFARLIGNYEGLFRNDNGQSDPNLTSQYDFPNSPLMSGQFVKGPLPSDVTHALHVFPTYQFQNRLRVGAGFNWSSGVPRTSLLAHPIYQNSGEIAGINPVYAYWNTGGTLTKTTSLSAALTDPNAAGCFGAGTCNPFLFDYTHVPRGNLGRTPDLVSVDLHADYPVAFGKSSLRFSLDVFNIFQAQEPTQYDDNVELRAGVTDPSFLSPFLYQSPRTWRLAARWDF